MIGIEKRLERIDLDLLKNSPPKVGLVFVADDGLVDAEGEPFKAGTEFNTTLVILPLEGDFYAG